MNLKLTSCLKLKSGGNGRPFGRRALGSRRLSKKGCVHASSCNWTISENSDIRTCHEVKQLKID